MQDNNSQPQSPYQPYAPQPPQLPQQPPRSPRSNAHHMSVMLERLSYILLGLLQVSFALRIMLSLLGANKDNVFASLVYGVSGPFVAPFLTLFNYQTTFGVIRFELETVIAMIAYAALGAAVIALVRLPRRA